MPLRILIVDDSQLSRSITAAQLQALGHAPDQAPDGAAALAALARSTYDLVLLDIQMPGLDGLEVARRIRSLGPAIAQPRIVALTAGGPGADRASCLTAGMDGYLRRPANPDDLALALAGPPPTATLSPLNPALIDELARTLGPAVLRQMADTFEREAPELLGALRAAIDRHDQAEAARLAHLLKGRALSLGAAELAARARSIELAAVAGDPLGVAAADALAVAYHAVADALRARVEQRGA